MEDFLITPAIFALNKQIKTLNLEDENDKIVYEALIRSRTTLENIKLHGIDIIGKSFQEFSDELKQKTNVVLMTDDELSKMNKALRLYSFCKNICKDEGD